MPHLQSHHSQITISTSSPPTQLQKSLVGAEGKLAHALAHSSMSSIANAVIGMPEVLDKLFSHFLRLIEEECRVLCKKAEPSQFRHILAKDMEKFEWMNFMKELQSKSPLLLKVLAHAVVRWDPRCETKSPSAYYPSIVTAAAVLLKQRNREMCGLQSLVSCLMYACHCEKQVCH